MLQFKTEPSNILLFIMRKLELILILICLFQASCFSRDDALPPRPVRDFSIVNENNAWLVTSKGELFHLLNGGQTKERAKLKATVQQIFSLNADICYLLDSSGRIWVTTNAGKEWLERGRLNDLNDSNLSSQLVFVDEQTGWLVTSFSVWLTQDGARSWNRVYPTGEFSYDKLNAQPMNYFAVNADIGWLGMSNAKILKTTDRGKTWENVSLSGNVDVQSLYAFNDKECSAGTWGKGGGLFQTLEGGKNWQKVLDDKLSPNLGLGINSISYVDRKLGWAAGRKFVESTDNPKPDTAVLLKTLDGGNSWMKIQTQLKEEEFTYVKFFDENNGWLVGRRTIYKSKDGGNSWIARAEFE